MAKHLRPDMVLYDVGCGKKPFKEFLRDRVRSHIGVDIADGFYAKDNQVDLIGSADNLPADINSADAVLSSQVLEHLQSPDAGIREAFRVLRPGGCFFVSCPFLYPIHAAPYDFTRMTRFALQKSLTDIGFRIVEFHEIGGFWYILGAFSILYLGELSLLKKLRLLLPLAWLIRMGFGLLYWLEGHAATAIGKRVEGSRSNWPMTYILVAQKPAKDQG